MQSKTINHKRITQIVRSVIDYEISKARSYDFDLRHEPDSEVTKAKANTFIPGIEFDDRDGVKRDIVTINKQFLALVGYDGNLEGFLADYFGSDYKPKKGEPLKFRFLQGFLVNPTVVKHD